MELSVDTGTRRASNPCSGEPGEVPDNEVNAHLGDTGSSFPKADPVLAAVREIWQRYPDMRLGQLLVNAMRLSEPCPQVDRRLRLRFFGAKVTSDAGLLAQDVSDISRRAVPPGF